MKAAALLIVVSLLGLAGCVSVQTHSFAVPSDANNANLAGQRSLGNIQILYAEPKRDYETLGTFSVRKYKPGFADPTVSDAIPELRSAAEQLGAQAVIIRGTRSNGYSRLITIEGEAIRWIQDGTSPH